MSLDLISTVLFGQNAASSWLLSPEVMTVLKLIIAIPLPIFLGVWLAKVLRMRDFGWKLALIFCSLCIGGVFLVSFPLRLGVDLKGGVILVYEIDRDALKIDATTTVSPSSIDWGHLLQRLNDRINPAGTKEIVVRRYGDWQVEVIIPDVDTNEVERIKKLISTAGSLEFRIVANSTQHGEAIQAATRQAESSDKRRSKYVMEGDRRVGYWARVGREANVVKGEFHPLKVHVGNYTIRNTSTGEILQVPQNLPRDQEYALERWLKEQGIAEIDVLMYAGDEYNVSGEDLGVCSRGYDEVANPCVLFNMKAGGAGLMGGLTADNLPDEQRGFYSLLGIMLDGTLLSAPRVMSTITDSGRITGQFTQEEVNFLVGILQAGSLPAALKKVPIAQNTIGAMVGDETIRRGKYAAGLALASTFVFMLIWYRFAGFVACLALAANLVLTLAVMKILGAPLTLPGLAGLVLGVGMAVDANVLVYERIREELERGAALRMAIRNGFDRAMVTIIDSNLTTLITSLVMYVIGTDQIRGFAITLTLGIVLSMYTAVFCARVVFEICERTRRITTLRMTKLFDVTHIDFLGKKYLALGLSLLFIVVGLVATAARGKQIFDIDFLGGTSVTMVLQQPAQEREIRDKLDKKFANMRVNDSAVQYSVNRVDVEGLQDRTVWKIDSSLAEVEDLEKVLKESFPVATHSMNVTQVTEKRTPLVPPTTEERRPLRRLLNRNRNRQKASRNHLRRPQRSPWTQSRQRPSPQRRPKRRTKRKPKRNRRRPANRRNRRRRVPAAAICRPGVCWRWLMSVNSYSRWPTPPKSRRKRRRRRNLRSLRKSLPPSRPRMRRRLRRLRRQRKSLPRSNPKRRPHLRTRPSPKKSPPPNRPRTRRRLRKRRNPKRNPPHSRPRRRRRPRKHPSPKKSPRWNRAKTRASQRAPRRSPSLSRRKRKTRPPRAKNRRLHPNRPRRFGPTATLTFDYKINARTVQDEITEAAGILDVPLTEEDYTVMLNAEDLAKNPDWNIDDSLGYKKWIVTVDKDRTLADKIFGQMERRMQQSPVWSSSSKIGGKVAGDTRNLAIVALIASWVGIIIYIWIRFQKIVFGLAAVVALIHDVLISLAAVAVSYYLAGVLGFLEVEEFKISLTVVVAFLTIIGYSVNDTIVVFDRIREVRGKSPILTEDMVNMSVNQTLSRTLLTGLCTIVNCVILYAIGGEGIHAFAYTLFIGFVSGTYSSIYIASPFVIWLYGGKPTARTSGS